MIPKTDMGNNKINFIAAVNTHDPEEMQQIAERLREKGCRIDRILSFTGIITGQSPGTESSLDALKVPGIKYIEEDGEVRAL